MKDIIDKSLQRIYSEEVLNEIHMPSPRAIGGTIGALLFGVPSLGLIAHMLEVDPTTVGINNRGFAGILLAGVGGGYYAGSKVVKKLETYLDNPKRKATFTKIVNDGIREFAEKKGIPAEDLKDVVSFKKSAGDLGLASWEFSRFMDDKLMKRPLFQRIAERFKDGIPFITKSIGIEGTYSYESGGNKVPEQKYKDALVDRKTGEDVDDN